MAEIIDLPQEHRHGEAGYFSLEDLPQRGSVADQAFGCGWHELDAILKFYLGQFIVLTGVPGHGKSTFILNVLLKLAIQQRTSLFLHVPENEGHLREKLRLMWHGSDAEFTHFCRSQCYVQSAVPQFAKEPYHTIDWVLDKAARAVQRDAVEIVLIDPWNELERAKAKDQTLTDYISESLMIVKQFCRSSNAIVIIVAHPTKAISQNSGKITSLYDIESSAAWFNKCDNGLIVVRDAGKNTSRVISAKVREIGAGKVGACHFYVDPLTGKFTPQYASDSDATQL